MAYLKRIIVGLGTTGLSCARYLRATEQEFEVVDSRLDPPALALFKEEFPEVTLRLGAFSESLLSSADELILSPGVSLQTPAIVAARAAGVRIVGDIAIFSAVQTKAIVAVTGSNGKSTVVTLLAMMARAAGMRVGLGGNLDGAEAAPALDLLRQEEKELYILELSSFQLETTPALNAELAVILNVSDDHMDRYASKRDYEAAKQQVFKGAKKIVVNRDDSASQPWHNAQAVVSHFTLASPRRGEWGIKRSAAETHLAYGSDAVLNTQELKIVGKHNLANALAALALGEAIGLPREAMINALLEFPGLPHRCQWLRSVAGVDYYNDSKGTNVGASLMAIESLGEVTRGKLILIAGGIGKGADFSPLSPVIEKFVRLVVLIGRDADSIAVVCRDLVEVAYASTLPEAVQVAADHAMQGDAVLLSPACASYDMFSDFTQRGRVFATAVEAL